MNTFLLWFLAVLIVAVICILVQKLSRTPDSNLKYLGFALAFVGIFVPAIIWYYGWLGRML